MEFTSDINYIAVVLAAAAAFGLGAAWYSPLALGKLWMRENGINEGDPRGNPLRTFGGAAVLLLLSGYILAVFIGDDPTLGTGLAAGLAIGTAFVAAAIGVTYLFEQRSLTLYVINAGYNAVLFTIMGGIIGILG